MSDSSPCLLRSFSQPSPTSQESTEGDPIRRALTSSVSFGRFVSESLVWEKWPSFGQNRYLEEVEKYSKPGSVAEKKAYFEAHYKKIAAKKAAAVLEQQRAAFDISSVNMANENDDNSPIDMEPAQRAAVGDTSVVNMTNENDANCPTDTETAQECGHLNIEEIKGENTLNTDAAFPFDANQHCLPKERNMESIEAEGAEQPIECPTFSDNHVESSNQLQVPVNFHDDQEVKTCFKDASTKGDSASSDKKEAANQLQVPVNFHDDQEVKTCFKDASTKGESASSDKKEAANCSGKSSKHNQESKIRSSVKSKIPIYTKKGNHATSPICKKMASQSLEKKKSNLKFLHMSINLTSCASHINQSSQKIVDSRLFKTVARTSKESSNQQTPTRAYMGGSLKHLSVIHKLENGRTKTLLEHSFSDSTSRNRLLNSPLMHISKSKPTCGRKAQSPTVSSSFSLRSEERAVKRKEKLEQKLNTEEAEKGQHQSKLKGKAKDDSKNVYRSVSSQVQANVNLHAGAKSSSIAMKKISILSSSPKIERKQAFEVHDSNSRPPWRLSMKTDSFRDVVGKNHRPLTYSAKLVPKKNMHENTSPNIQL